MRGAQRGRAGAQDGRARGLTSPSVSSSLFSCVSSTRRAMLHERRSESTLAPLHGTRCAPDAHGAARAARRCAAAVARECVAERAARAHAAPRTPHLWLFVASAPRPSAWSSARETRTPCRSSWRETVRNSATGAGRGELAGITGAERRVLPRRARRRADNSTSGIGTGLIATRVRVFVLAAYRSCSAFLGGTNAGGVWRRRSALRVLQLRRRPCLLECAARAEGQAAHARRAACRRRG